MAGAFVVGGHKSHRLGKPLQPPTHGRQHRIPLTRGSVYDGIDVAGKSSRADSFGKRPAAFLSPKIRYRSLIAEKIRDPRLRRIPTIAAAKADNRKSGSRDRRGYTRIVEVSQYAVPVPGSEVR